MAPRAAALSGRLLLGSVLFNAAFWLWTIVMAVALIPFLAFPRQVLLKGVRALRSLIKEAEAALARGQSIVIFPEGTRVAPGAHRPYHPGVAALYLHLGCPVVPVALNSGLFWGRRSFVKRPGRITVEILPPIEPGLNRAAFMTELERRLEGATLRLVEEARQVRTVS